MAWSDVSIFKLFGTKGRVQVWRKSCGHPVVRTDSSVGYDHVAWVGPLCMPLTSFCHIALGCVHLHPFIDYMEPNKERLFQPDNAPRHPDIPGISIE